MGCSSRQSSPSSAYPVRPSPPRPSPGVFQPGKSRPFLTTPTRLDRYVATAQLGTAFASLGLGMYGEHTLAAFFEHWLTEAGFTGLDAQITAHGLSVVLAILAIAYLHIVFGEMIPKALALGHAARVALWVTPIMLMIGLVLFPLVRALNLTGNNLLRLIGVVRSRSAEHYLETEELESLARESQQSGLLSAESERIFREIADFSEITAAEAMIPRVHAYGIPVGATVAELREILRSTGIPVILSMTVISITLSARSISRICSTCCMSVAGSPWCARPPISRDRHPRRCPESNGGEP